MYDIGCNYIKNGSNYDEYMLWTRSDFDGLTSQTSNEFVNF